MDTSQISTNITDFSPELLCNILKYLPLKEILSVGMLCRKLLIATNMYFRFCKSIDFCPNSVDGYMPSSITDDHFRRLLKKCPHLQEICGLHPVKEERRKLRKRSTLTVHGIIAALKLCFKLKAIETSDLRLLEAVLQHLPHIEIIGHFQNRDGTFPPLASQKLKLQSFPKITSLDLTGVEVPELTSMPQLKHLYLHCVRFTKLQPFRVFSAQNLESFVMRHCMGPSMSLRYLSLVIALSSCPNLEHLELARVPLPGGLFQRAVEDSHRQNGFVNLKTLVISGCKGVLEADVGHLMIVSSKNLQTLFIQPSLTKDSLFVSLSFAQCSFPSLCNLHLGYVDALNHSGEWSNNSLLALGLADVPDTPSSITDSGMKTVSQLFPLITSLTVSNCPHLMVMYQWMPNPNVNAWSKLKHLTLQKNHCLQLTSFTLFISVLPCIEVIVLNEMFKEPPKGCSHVGLSAGTGLGMSSAVVSNQDEHMSVQGHHQDFDHPGEDENEEVEREFVDGDEDNQEPHFMVLRGDFFEEDDDIDPDYIDYESRYFNGLRREEDRYSSDDDSTETSDDNTDVNTDNERSFSYNSLFQQSSSFQNYSENAQSPSCYNNENNNSISDEYTFWSKRTSDSNKKLSKSVGVQVEDSFQSFAYGQSVNRESKKEDVLDSDALSKDSMSALPLNYDPYQPSTSTAGNHFNYSESPDVSNSGVYNNHKVNAKTNKSKKQSSLKKSTTKTKYSKELDGKKGLSSKTDGSSDCYGTHNSVCIINKSDLSSASTDETKVIKQCYVNLTRIEDKISVAEQEKKFDLTCYDNSSALKGIVFCSESDTIYFSAKHEHGDTQSTAIVTKETRNKLNDRELTKAMKCFVRVSKIESAQHFNFSRNNSTLSDYSENQNSNVFEKISVIKIKDERIEPVIDVSTDNSEIKVCKDCRVMLTKIEHEIQLNSKLCSNYTNLIQKEKSKKNKILSKNICNETSLLKSSHSFSDSSDNFEDSNLSYDPCQPSTSKVVLNSDCNLNSEDISHNIKSGKYYNLRKGKCSTFDSKGSYHKKEKILKNEHDSAVCYESTKCYVNMKELQERGLCLKSECEKIEKIDCSKINLPKEKKRKKYYLTTRSSYDSSSDESLKLEPSNDCDSDSSSPSSLKRLKRKKCKPLNGVEYDYLVLAPHDSIKPIKIFNPKSQEVFVPAWCSVPLTKSKIIEVEKSNIPLKSNMQSNTTNSNIPSTSKLKNTCNIESHTNCDCIDEDCFQLSERELSINENFAFKGIKRFGGSEIIRNANSQRENNDIPEVPSRIRLPDSEVRFAPRFKYSILKQEGISRHEVLRIKPLDAMMMSIVPRHSSATSLASEALISRNIFSTTSSPSSSHTRKRLKEKDSLSLKNGAKSLKYFPENKKLKINSKFTSKSHLKRKRKDLDNESASISAITIISEGTQANSADIRRSLRRVRRTANSQKASSFTTKTIPTRSSKISAKNMEKKPITKNHSPETQDKSTSTSDPLLEDDAVQTLKLSSDTLLSFSVIACGISDLTLDRCPRLFHLEVQACRILKKFLLNTCPAMKRLNISQCPKLVITEVSSAVFDLTTDSYFLVSYEPCMQNYHFGHGEKAVLSKAAPNQSVLLCHDFHKPSSESIQANFKEKILEWLHYLGRLHATLNYSRGKSKRKKNDQAPSPEYPWSHDLRKVHGEYLFQLTEFCSAKGQYSLLTNNPIFADAFETRNSDKGFPSVKDCEASRNNSLLSFEAVEKYFQMQKKFVGFYIPITEYNRIEAYKIMQPRTPPC